MMSDIYKECTLSKRKGNLIVRLWEVYQENAKGEKICVKWEIELAHRLLFNNKIIEAENINEAMLWYKAL